MSSDGANPCTLTYTDQTGKEILLKAIPKRIISLVPSQTELLYDLGLETEVVGITKFCIHPKEWFQTKTRVGGTKQLNLEVIHELLPDLVIANKEENVKEQVEALQKDIPVWTSDINDLSSACEMIEQLGTITGKQHESSEIVSRIRKNFSELPKPISLLSAIYLIWQKPFMTVGGDTFIHAMMEAAGFSNMYAEQTRYPELTIGALLELQPRYLLLSTEPFPFNESHVTELQSILPATRILLVDGEMFSWYGSRLQYAPGYFSSLAALARMPV